MPLLCSVVKNLPARARDTEDMSVSPGSGRSAGGGNGNLLHYFRLENPMDRGAWWATVQGGLKKQHTSEHAHVLLLFPFLKGTENA